MKNFPVYKFGHGQWGKREYLFHASTDSLATDFACAWNRANTWSNGSYLAPSHDTDDKLDTYRGWHISWEYGYYTAYHDNYDASWEGDEDGWVDNGLKLSERTLDSLITEIDLHEASFPMSWCIVAVEDTEEL